MIPIPDFAGRAVAVSGLGDRGLAAALALKAGGARPLTWDDRADLRARAFELDLEAVDLREHDWRDIAALVITPRAGAGEGEQRLLERAERLRVPVLGDFELFARARAARPKGERGRVVAVMGARGKSSVAALVKYVLEASGRDAQVGGEVGEPPLALAPPHPGAIYVLELRARDVALAPSLEAGVALFLNADAAHDESKGAAAAGPARRFGGLTRNMHVVIGVDDAFGRGLASEIRTWEGGPVVTPVSAGRVLGRGVHAVGGVLFDALDGRAREILDLRRAKALIARPHWQNAAAAYAACRYLGVEPGVIARNMTSYPGLPHRLEPVARRGAVRLVNDSYATSPAAAAHALAAFENIYWIAGGRAGGQSLDVLAGALPNVAKAYLIGESAESLASELKGRTVAEICRELGTAVIRALADAERSSRPDPVVLLSPACFATDQFKDAAARGDAFRSIVKALPVAGISGEAA